MVTNINPKISIITITRNRAGFIAKAVQSALNQSFTDWELIILDDDSKDGTEGVIKSFMATESHIKYHKNSPPLGISANRNKGLSLATGKYMAVLDSDDEWIDKDKLQKQYDFLENNQEYVLMGSNIKIVNEKGDFIKNTNFAIEDRDIRGKILKDNQIPHSSVLIKTDSIKKVGGYSEKLSCVEDLDLFLRLGKVGKMKNLSEVTTSYTKHSQGTSHQRKIAMAWNHLCIIWKNFSKYPNWFTAMVWAKLRLIKSLF